MEAFAMEFNSGGWAWMFAGMVISFVLFAISDWMIKSARRSRMEKRERQRKAEAREAKKTKVESKIITATDVRNQRFVRWYQSGEASIHRIYESSIGSYMMTLNLGDEVGIRIIFEGNEVFTHEVASIRAAVQIAYEEVSVHYNEYSGPARHVEGAIRIANEVLADE